MATINAISKNILIVCLLLLCLLPQQSRAAGFNTAQLIYNSLQVKCLDWKIIGLCFWLKCSPKCKIKTTPKISHYLPDLTVTNSPGKCPWQEVALLSLKSPDTLATQLIAKVTGGNPGQGGRLGRYAMKFKDAMVVGNPTAKLSEKFNVPFLCKSQAKPMHIYFNSRQGLNALTWRGIDLSSLQGIAATDVDRIESWKPGSRLVGRGKLPDNTHADNILLDNGWGSIYPRRGTVLNPNDVKAGAVIAQRAIEIVVRNPDGYHNVTSTDTHDDERWETWGDPKASDYRQCRASGGRWQQHMQNAPFRTPDGRCLQQRSVQQRDIGSETDDRWQMIYPEVENTCSSFDDRARETADWSLGKASADGAYGYNFWQQYKCCIPRSGIYLFSVEW